MINKTVFFLLFSCCSFCSTAQSVGELKEIRVLLIDMPISGDAIQVNFNLEKPDEYISFDYITWLDKHLSLFEFYHTYKDSCVDANLQFRATMVYIPMEVHNFVRYEGFIPTGKIENTWVLTSILKEEEKE